VRAVVEEDVGMPAVRIVVTFVGIGLVLATWWSVLTSLVVPRGRRSWITTRVFAALRAPFVLFSRMTSSYERIDAFRAAEAPVALIGLLLTWLALFVLGFMLVFTGLGTSLGDGLRDAGSSVFTLGFSAPKGQLAVVCTAAASGLIVVALQIGYLPSLYGAFNRRETLVTLLATRAGVPAWGPEILVRHQSVGIIDSLAGLYTEWEIFGADLAESHTNYPVLVYFRSPQPSSSWVIGLLAVLDAAALHLALSPGTAPSSARLCLRMGYTSLRAIAGSVGEPVDDDPKPDDAVQLSYEEFAEACAYVRASGFPVERDVDEAWPHFRGWRVNYEQAAIAIARRTDAPRALWSGSRRNRTEPLPPHQPRDRRPGDREGLPQKLPTWPAT
jgi:hypothetical protein